MFTCFEHAEIKIVLHYVQTELVTFNESNCETGVKSLP